MSQINEIINFTAIVWFFAVHSVRLLGIGLHAARVWQCRSDTTSDAPHLERNGQAEGVTIIRPMKGSSDLDLYKCLRSTFTQDYTHFEILMCVSDPQDAAVSMAHQLLREFPHIDAKVLVGPDPAYGINPKVNNLVKGYKRAKYDIIWALDSNVMVDKKTLSRAVPKLKGRVQLVHHLPLAQAGPGAGWGGYLDETYMSTAHSTFYTGINAVGIAPCVTGKSNLYRRSDLDAAAGVSAGDGLQTFSCYMAEDQMISESLWAKGGRTAIAADAAVQPLGAHIDLKEFWWRRARWIRLRKYMVTSATLVEPFTDCFFHALFLSYMANHSLLLTLLHILAWCISDWINSRILVLYTTQDARPLTSWLLSWLVRETLAFPLWLWAMSGRRIWWRNRPYKINSDLTAQADC